jgi:restriction system protein
MATHRAEAGDPHAAFVDRYLADDNRRVSVVAQPGMGKTTIAMRLASEMVRSHRADFALVLSAARSLRDNLIHLGSQHGLHLAESMAGLARDKPAGICLTTAQLNVNAVGDQLLNFAAQSSLFILVDEANHAGSGVPDFVSQLIDRHPNSRLLVLITPFSQLLSDPETPWRALVDVEYLFEPGGLREQSLIVQSVVIARTKADEGRLIEAVAEPWFEIIEAILRDPTIAHQLGARKWEEIVAGAYVRAGFDDVILTPTSGDRGRDIIATKYGMGTVRVIDQVKAFKPGHLVTANDVRALMGVLHSDGASKGFVTTTSGFAPRLLRDPLIAPLMPSRLELVDGARLVCRLSELAAVRHKRSE